MALKRVPILAIIATLLAAVLLVWLAWSGRDEREIRRRLHALARQCEKLPDQGMFRTLTELSDLPAAFTSNAVIQLGRPYPTTTTPRELASLVARARVEVTSLRVIVQGIEFLPRSEPGAIDTRTAVELRVKRDQKTEEFVDEYRLRWRKEGGIWRIESARTDSAIHPPW